MPTTKTNLPRLYTREGYAKLDRSSIAAEFFGASGYLGGTYLEAEQRARELGDSIEYGHVVMTALDGTPLARAAQNDESEDELVEKFKRTGHDDGFTCVIGKADAR